MSSLHSYRQAFASLPEALRQQRQPLFDQFCASGFPGKRLEDWRYTDLSALGDAEFAEPADQAFSAAAARRLLATPDGFEPLLWVNGLRSDDSASPPPATLADDGVTALNGALCRSGLDLTVEAGQQRRLWLSSHSDGGQSHLRHRIVIGRGASACLLMESHAADAALLATEVSDITLEAGARLQLIRVQRGGAASHQLSRSQISIGRDARLDYVGLDLGEGLSRHDLNIELAAPGAEAQLGSIIAVAGKGHHDTHSRIHHSQPHTTSRQRCRSLVMDAAQLVFNGRILVRPAAQKTDSDLQLASLLLSPRAQVNAKPELEIYADDVRCAHGSSCGQIDEAALYYLRSRGLDEATARSLLLYTFVHPVIGMIDNDALRTRLQQALIAQLPGTDALETLL